MKEMKLLDYCCFVLTKQNSEHRGRGVYVYVYGGQRDPSLWYQKLDAVCAKLHTSYLKNQHTSHWSWELIPYTDLAFWKDEFWWSKELKEETLSSLQGLHKPMSSSGRQSAIIKFK